MRPAGILLYDYKEPRSYRWERRHIVAVDARTDVWISTHFLWIRCDDVFRIVGQHRLHGQLLLACEDAYALDDRTWGVSVAILSQDAAAPGVLRRRRS